MLLSGNISSKDNIYNMVRILSKNKTGVRIAHINAQSLSNKLDEFKYIFTTSGLDVICVSESWFHYEIQDSIYNLPGYKLFRADRKTHAGGVAIYVRDSISCIVKTSSTNFALENYSTTTDIEYLFLEIASNGKKALIGCVYRPKSDIPQNILSDALSYITLSYNDIIITGDFNSNLFTDSLVLDLMESLNLFSINMSTPTHFHKSSNSLLDLFFVNDNTIAKYFPKNIAKL